MKPQAHFQLLRFNTLGVRSIAEYGVLVDTDEGLIAAATWAMENGLPLTILGGGSNVILAPHIAGLVVIVRNRGRTCKRSGQEVLITAKAGENWHDLVRFSLGQGLAGLQTMVLIPGLVGAAPIQNIGAYGSELADSFVSLTAYDCKRRMRIQMSAPDCAFGYRDSRFKDSDGSRYLILDVTLQLGRSLTVAPAAQRYGEINLELAAMGIEQPSPVQIAEAVSRIRRRKLPDPRRFGNVGSVFKNPVVSNRQAEQLRSRIPGLKVFPTATGQRLSAAQLIDRAGCKQKTIDASAVWARQPLVLVQNERLHPPTAQAFCQLLEDVQSAVALQFGVALQAEPQRLGWLGPGSK